MRRSEEKVCDLYPEDGMKTPLHMSLGQEALVGGICSALAQEDQIFATYRSHAAYLAKTEDTDDFFAEMYAKDSARLKGKGGSMHLCNPDHGFMGSSAIVASHIPVGAGAAYANKVKKNNKITAVFFGDGAVDEGVFWETLNVACLMKLPLIFVCEDNDLAVHTFVESRRGYRSLSNAVSAFNCKVLISESTDVEVIYQLTQRAIEHIRENCGPVFMELKYYRYLEHVGINYDFEAGYRSRTEYEKWLSCDPINAQRVKLQKLGVPTDQLSAIETEIESKITRSIQKAQEAPFCSTQELYNGVFK